MEEQNDSFLHPL